MLYPELQNVPEECGLGPLPSSPIPISVPYGNVEIAEGVMMQAAPIPGNHPARRPLERVINEVQESYDPANIGYQSDAERDALDILRPQAARLRNNTAFYEPGARDRIVNLADIALRSLNEIVAIYQEFETSPDTRLPFRVSSPGRGDQVLWQNIPLSEPESSIAPSIDTTEIDFWSEPRVAARAEIRQLWDRALWDLWCAEVGANQSRSYRANRQAYNDQQAGTPSGPGALIPGPLPGGPLPGFILTDAGPGPGPGPDPLPPIEGGFAEWGEVPPLPDPQVPEVDWLPVDPDIDLDPDPSTGGGFPDSGFGEADDAGPGQGAGAGAAAGTSKRKKRGSGIGLALGALVAVVLVSSWK